MNVSLFLITIFKECLFPLFRCIEWAVGGHFFLFLGWKAHKTQAPNQLFLDYRVSAYVSRMFCYEKHHRKLVQNNIYHWTYKQLPGLILRNFMLASLFGGELDKGPNESPTCIVLFGGQCLETRYCLWLLKVLCNPKNNISNVIAMKKFSVSVEFKSLFFLQQAFTWNFWNPEG